MEAMVMNITEKDVGRKVVLRNGDVEFIEKFDGSKLPVKLSNRFWLYGNGSYWDDGHEEENDIIGFADDTEIERTPEIESTKDKLLELVDGFIAAKNYDAARKMIDAIELLDK